MKISPRLEKKLSKRLCEIAPNLFKDAWVDNDVMESACGAGVSTSNAMMIGGGIDYWGEANDAYTCWKWWTDSWVFYLECDGIDVIDCESGDWNHKAIPSNVSTRYLLSLAKRANQYYNHKHNGR